jgi:hypothetical protein
VALSALTNATASPTHDDVARVLGPVLPLWDDLVDRLDDRWGPLTPVWKHAGAKYGWSLRLKRRDRTLVYLIPTEGGFLAALVFGERAVDAIRAARLPAAVKRLVEQATPYVEGRGIRLAVRSPATVRLVERLVALKLA